jgi:hypothetical protein
MNFSNEKISAILKKKRSDMWMILAKNLVSTPILIFLSGLGLGRAWPLPQVFIKGKNYLGEGILFLMGVKGGMAMLATKHAEAHFIPLLACLVLIAICQPTWVYYILCRAGRISPQTGCAIGACLGSVSVLTFASAIGFLEYQQQAYNSQLQAFLALLEIPGIIGAYLLYLKLGLAPPLSRSWSCIFKNKALLSLGAGLLIGAIVPQTIWVNGRTLLNALFQMTLSSFLLFMGWQLTEKLSRIKALSLRCVVGAMGLTLLHATMGLGLSWFFKMSIGSATLICTLLASASYIAAPSAIRQLMPGADESLYFPLSIGVIFPFNILLGIPLYFNLAHWILS